MILVDANLLLYAEDSLSSHHAKARQWWDAQLSGGAPVCLCWEVIGAFLRISTNKQIFRRPLTLEEAAHRVQSWLAQPCVRVVVPADDHWEIFRDLLDQGQAAANLVTDAHLAALAIEHSAVLYSTDSDFARFSRLKWENPLKAK